jgi:hypothetical protein
MMKKAQALVVIFGVGLFVVGCAKPTENIGYTPEPIGAPQTNPKKKSKLITQEDKVAAQQAVTAAAPMAANAGEVSNPEITNSDRAFEVYEIVLNAAYAAKTDAVAQACDQSDVDFAMNCAASDVALKIYEAHPEAVLMVLYAIGDDRSLNQIYSQDPSQEEAVISGLMTDTSKGMARFLALVAAAIENAGQTADAKLVEIQNLTDSGEIFDEAIAFSSLWSQFEELSLYAEKTENAILFMHSRREALNNDK